MNEKEGNNWRERNEGDNLHKSEQETISMEETTEKIITATFRTGLKVGETKEKFFISKDNKKLQTDRKSINFHREKRNNRFQVDRLSDLEDSGIENEDSKNDDTDNSKTAEIEGINIEKNEPKELEVETEANAQSKKTARRKMHERMREQRQRGFNEEGYNTENGYIQYYNEEFSDFEDYDGYENYADTESSELPTDNSTNIDKAIGTLNHQPNEEKEKPFDVDNSDKSSKLKSNTKRNGLKQEKSEVKLKTDKKDSLDITLNQAENKLNRKQLKLRKRQLNNLVNKKYNLKNARLAYVSATSKLIINSGEEKQSPIDAVQGNNNTKQGQNYAEQEQENLNRNLTNVAKTGLKSVISDFEAFEANLFADDNVNALQKKFNKKKQQKAQHIKKKAEKAEELKRANNIKGWQTKKSEYQADKITLENRNDKDVYPLNSRDSANSNLIFNRRNDGKREDTNSNVQRKKDITTNNDESNSKNGSFKNTPTDSKDNKTSRLQQDKKQHNRKNELNATDKKIKFSKENASWHEHKEEKLRHNRNKGNTKENTNVSSVSNKNKEPYKKLQKKNNKKAIQKKAIKNQKKLSENTLTFGKKAGKATAKQTLEAVKFLARLILKKIVALILFIISQIAIIGTLIMIPVIIISLIGVIFLGSTGTMLLSTYLAEDETLSQVSVYYSDKERDLTNSLTENAIKTTYNVDEVNYIFVDNIGHNSHYLLSYLTAKYQNFTFEQVQNELGTIFGLQYTKTVTVRDVVVEILDSDGEPTGEFETRRIADVTLKNNGFYDILYSRLSSDEREHFLLLVETTGNRQYGSFPMSWDWLINIIENFNNLNNGVEAEVPVNTAVYGTINGEILNATANSVSIQGSIGEEVIIITFSRLNSVSVNVGETVEMTTIVGYTSDRIFIQIQRNGVYINPVLFLGSQRQDLVYGTSIPPLTQSEFNALKDFASTAIGTPYVFGGTGPPPRGIDCSGFIWWAFNGSGIKSWGRTTAQGQFNQCDPITFADARPGDLIFFQGTYDTQDSRIVTHVGIYLGNGQMQHSGTPNQITSIQSSYWQKYFYSFGRLRR